MKHLPNRAAGAALLLCATLAAGPAAADTLINIKGHGSDGAGTVLPLSYPLPVGTEIELDQPVLLNLGPGSYSLLDAWGMPGALYDTWNFEVPQPGSWASHYVVAELLPSGRFSVLVDGQSLADASCQNHFCAWSTRAQAVAAFLATPAYSFTLDHAATVGFVSADYYLPDNDGGISLWMTAAAVPEPAAGALLSAGMAGLAGLAWRRRTAPAAR